MKADIHLTRPPHADSQMERYWKLKARSLELQTGKKQDWKAMQAKSLRTLQDRIGTSADLPDADWD